MSAFEWVLVIGLGFIAIGLPVYAVFCMVRYRNVKVFDPALRPVRDGESSPLEPQSTAVPPGVSV